MVDTWPNVTEDSALEFVQNHKQNGTDYIKLMQENCCSFALPTNSIPCPTVEFQRAIVEAAHQEGLLAVGHATSLDNTEVILKAGGDGLTHAFVDQAPTEDLVKLYKETNAFLIPTLSALSSLTAEEHSLREKYAGIAKSKGLIDDFILETMLCMVDMKAPEATIEYAYATIKRLKAEGIDIVAGTDAAGGLKGTAIGPSLWQELDMYVDKCDFTPTEALSAATGVSVKRFGFQDRGVIEEDKRADLVLVEGDLEKSLECLYKGRGITHVWKHGIAAKL
jgi:imidazolonepropionase-like amidohydrolase